MTTHAVTACVLALTICLPAVCEGQYYWGANAWRQYWQPSSSAVCDRAYPARQTGGYVHSCHYYCSGLPVRYSFEQDGTPCYTNRWIAGACYAGRCTIGWWPVQPQAAPQASATAAPAATTERSSLESKGWSWPSEDADSQHCTRADSQVSTVRRSCRYLCKGWPIRHENEADGTACQLSWWREGFCFRGHCQRNYPLPPVPRDDDNEIEGGNDPVRNLKCRNYKGRVKVDGVVRSCKFVCKLWKKALVAYEENGTPCAALPGQNGFCDQGVCKAVESTPAPSEASEASTEHETEEPVADVSSVTDATPVTAATITTQDAAAAETEQEAITAASTTETEQRAVAPSVRSPWTPGFVGVQCDRAYPPKVVDGRVLKCRFLCQGYPRLRIGFEEDGTPCLKKKTLEGVCFSGNCKTLPPPTDATTLNEETTTVESYVSEADALSTSEIEETTKDERASTDEATVASTAETVVEGEVTDGESGAAGEGGASTAADVEDVAAAESSKTGIEGKDSGVTSASESAASAVADLEEPTPATDSSSMEIEGKASDTSASGSGASAAADVDETPTATDSSRTGTEGEVSDATPGSESGASAAAEVEKASADSESNSSDADDEVSEATSASDIEAAATSDAQGTAAATDSEVQEGSSPKEATVTEGEEPQSVGATESASTLVRAETSTIESITAVAENEVTAKEKSTLDEELEGPALAGESSTASKGDQDETAEASSESQFLITEAQAGAEEVSTRAATAQPEDLEILTKIPSSDEAVVTAAPASSQDKVQVTSTASGSPDSDLESSTQNGAEETTDTSAGGDGQADQASAGSESQSTLGPSFSDVPSAPASTVEQPSVDTTLNNDDSVSKSSAAPGFEVELTTSTSAAEDVPSDQSSGAITTTEAIVERTEETVVVTTREELTINAAEGTIDTGSAGTEESAKEVSSAESVTQVKETEKKESTESIIGDATTAASSGEDLTTSHAAETAVESDTTVATEVAAERVFTANERPASQPDEGELTTPPLSSAATETQHDVVQGTEASFEGGATENTNVENESATVKVITTITRKEIIRPVDPDAAQPDADLVQETSTTSDAQTTVESANTAETEVAAEGVFTTNERTESQPSEGESTTPSLSSAATEMLEDVVQGTEASFPRGTTEATSAADESATVKVITTITRKEIVRPVGGDTSQADATLVQKTSSTSVQTLPVSVLNDTAESSPAVPAAGSPSKTSVVEGADGADTEAVSSGPSLVITDFVQKSAASSKDSATTPSVQEESGAAAESDSEVNVTV